MQHTLVIPTRNRPEYISVAVKQYLASEREDIRCLVCDASDNPEDVLSALSDYRSDDRLSIINNTAKTNCKISGMRENWSLALDNVESKWVTFIGDDDFLYPELVDYLDKLETKIPDLHAVRWATGSIPVPPGSNVKCRIPLGRKGILADTKPNIKDNFNWTAPPKMPSKIAGLYHGTVTMDLLKSIKDKRGSWFKYNYIDYEMGWIVASEIPKAVYSSRLFSINGYSPKSNSWATRKLDARRERAKDWLEEGGKFDYFSEHGGPYLEAGLDQDFFFALPVAIFGTMLLVAEEIGFKIDRQAKLNFAKTLIAKGQVQMTISDYEWYMNNAKIFLSTLLGQNVELNARFIETETSNSFRGLENDTLFMDRSCLPKNYDALAEQIKGMLVPVSYLD